MDKVTAIEQAKLQVYRVKGFFKWASIDRDLLKFELDGTWLTVELKTPVNFNPEDKDYKFTLVGAQDLTSRNAQGIYTMFYQDVELVNRITLLLADQLASARQDIAGITTK